MNKKNMTRFIILILCISGTVWANKSSESSHAPGQCTKTDSVDAILDKLHKTTSNLTSFECQIEYKYMFLYQFMDT